MRRIHKAKPPPTTKTKPPRLTRATLPPLVGMTDEQVAIERLKTACSKLLRKLAPSRSRT